MSAPAESPRAKVARRCRAQALGCEHLGSALYGQLLKRIADDVDAAGPSWDVVAQYAGDPGGSNLALRLMGATHRMALDGRAPGLAAHYPSCGGDADADAAWAAWYALVRDRPDEVRPEVAKGVQTNEVGRAAALLGGFLTVARETGRPLRLLEVGTSAGLNLRWDHFRYAAGEARWGPAGAPVDLGDPFVGVAPRLDPAAVEIVERRGCDVRPVDPTTSEGRRLLLSFVWPDQTGRFANLVGACDLAARVAVQVETESGETWLARHLAVTRPGPATVVFHSVMLQYMTAAGREALRDTLLAAGAAATADAPLAWLRLEPVDRLDSDFEVRLVTWPDGRDRRLAIAHPHGVWVRWEGG